MKYILGIGLLFQYFKGTTVVKIFSDDVFIDELLLDEHIKPCKVDRLNLADNFDPENPHFEKKKTGPDDDREESIPEKFYYYEIDESILGDRISFEFNDINSNYTNGFMTKSNQISFHTVFLLPKITTNSRFWKFMHDRDGKITDFSKSCPRYGKAEVNHDWPVAIELCNDKHEKSNRFQWYGGKQKIHIDVHKKYGTYYIWKSKDKETIHPIVLGQATTFITYRHLNLINTNNEDQRNNNTKN